MHDLTGRLLKVGDEVIVRCKVKSVQANPEYCNITVETVLPMYPGNNHDTFTLNSRQVEKWGNVDHESPKPGDEGDPTASG